jgi:hypothetical protein
MENGMVDLTVENVFPDGPSSAPTQPNKATIRRYFKQFEVGLDAGLSNGGLIYDTKANMDADLAHDANSSAWVIADSTVANNGIYRKDGASGSGSWTRIADLPYSFICASNAGAGTANAIQGTTSIPIPAGDGAAEIVLNITEKNTGAATVSFNGGPALTIKTATGADVQEDYLVAGAVVSGFVVGSTFRLTSEVGTAAAAAAAQAAADAAIAAASGVVSTQKSRANASVSYHPAVAPDFIQTAGYASAGDGGGALYKKVAAEPSHEGKFSITLDDGVTVVWFEIAETTIPVKALGAKGDTVSVTITASIASGSASLTAVGAAFTSDDVGKVISIPGASSAGGGVLGTTISAVVNSESVTLADAASATLSSESVTIGYGTDDTQALEDAAKVATGRVLWFAPGSYSITKAVPVYSKTTVCGVYGTSIIQPARKYTGTPTCDGACLRNSTFATASSFEESDILIEDMAFDYTYRPQGSSVGQGVGVFLRFVERPKVIRCLQWYGGDLSGMLQCRDTQVSDCVAHEIVNCAYDHWSGSGYIIVSNCINRNETVTPNQCIQVTADVTDPETGVTTGPGNVEKIVIDGNVIDVPAKGTTSGIIVNCLRGDSTASDVVVSDNYVRGTDYGIVMQGAVDGFVIDGNMIRDTTTQGVLAVKSSTGAVTSPTNGIVLGNLIADCGGIGIDITYGSDIFIAQNKVNNPTSSPIRLQTNSSDCVVKDNMIDGEVNNLGTNNTVMKIGASQPKSVSTSVYSGSAAPTSFTDLDISSVVGANKAICTARVDNHSGSTATFLFRTNGDGTVETVPSTPGTGPNICSMQNNEGNYVTFITDGSGIVEWCSTVGAGTTTITILSYQPLR